MQFASCQWTPYARSFIVALYPSTIIDDEKIPKLIELIGEDVLRVQDPAMHQPCQIVAGKNYTDDRMTEINTAIAELQEHTNT